MSDRGIVYDIRRKMQVAMYNVTSPEFVSKIYFKHILGYPLNLDNPKSFNEKIQWLKLYEWPNNGRAIQCADKYLIRDYMQNKGLGQHLNQLIGVWDKAEDIDWEKLPLKFVLKLNSGSAYNIICTNKNDFNFKRATKQLNKWLNEDFGKFNAEPHYSKISRKIICERFLESANINYKFFCLNGKAIIFDIDKDNLSETFFDSNKNILNVERSDFPAEKNVIIPDEFDKLKQLSEYLAADFPFVRVDWYLDNHKPILSEMTFTPCGGLIPFTPREFDMELGEKLDISQMMKNRMM